jgi:hypothetical protein
MGKNVPDASRHLALFRTSLATHGSERKAAVERGHSGGVRFDAYVSLGELRLPCPAIENVG